MKKNGVFVLPGVGPLVKVRSTRAVPKTKKVAKDEAADVMQNALAVLGSPERLAEWMQTPIPALRGRTPFSVMNTKQGRKEVETVLGRIEHGIY